MEVKLFPFQKTALQQTDGLKEFVPIRNYEELYLINSKGDVFSIRNKILLKQSERNGYPYVTLYKDKKLKKHYVHRLVAESLIENPHGFGEVNHMDSNRKNNLVTNLEWCTRSYNIKHSYTVGKRVISVAHNFGKNYRGVSVIVIDGKERIEFEKMKDASAYLGQHKHYVSERFRRTGQNEIVFNGKVVMKK